MLRPILPGSRHRSLFFALVACGVVFACTEQQSEDGPLTLSRIFPTSSEPAALAFDGVDDYATTGTAQFPSGQSNQTISAWFQVADLSGKHALITLRKDGDSGIELGLKDGVVGAWRVHSNGPLVVATRPITTGAWHHVAYTFDNVTNQLYVDGLLVASSMTSPDERTPTSCWLGTLDGTSDLFRGQVDSFRVFGTTRSSAQIAAEAAGTSPGADAGLVLDLRCDETRGNIVFDYTPLGNDAQLGEGIEQRMPKRVQPGVRANAN